jgi:AcrR family transcriptional regulator
MTDVVEQTDGRRARRERGRLAVLDAMVDLIREGHAPPTTEEIADRAGVSVASLFRYFPTLEELQRQTSARFMERYAPLLDVRDSAVGPFGERVDRYVSARIVLYETIGPVARFARGRSFSRPQLVANLAEMHRRHADVTRHHFAAELRARTPAAADDAVALVTSITSFDAWELLRSDLGRSRAQVRRAWTAGIDSLLRAPTTVG